MSMSISQENSGGGDRTPDAVLSILREQRTLYTELASLASKQRSLITGDDPSRLLTLLAKRQRVSACLTDVARRFEPFKENWDEVKTGFDAAQRSEAEHLLDDIRKFLRRIIEGDELDAKLLSARKQATAGALRHSHAAQQAVSAYQVPRQASKSLNCLDGA